MNYEGNSVTDFVEHVTGLYMYLYLILIMPFSGL